MRVLKHRKITIVQSEINYKREAIIISHGGYSSRKDFLRRGSPTISIPYNVRNLFFNSAHGEPVYGGMVFLLLSPENVVFPRPPKEELSAGENVVDYNITTGEEILFANQLRLKDPGYDIIYPEPFMRHVHLSDVFAAIEYFGLHYQKVYANFCRVDKREFRR